MSNREAASAAGGRPLKAGPEVIEHWFMLVPGQQFSSDEFYTSIAAQISEQKVPSLDISRVEISEGGALSDNREYLRMRRERIIFDVCAAPVGVNYFFSYRFYVERAAVAPWQVVVLLAAGLLLLDVSMKHVGVFLGPTLFVAVLAILGWTMRNAIGLGLRDLDATLLKMPVIGPVYERYFRKDSYYRQDLRIAYCSIVSALVKGRVEKVTGEKGVKLLKEWRYSPVFDGAYAAKLTKLVPGAGTETDAVG